MRINLFQGPFFQLTKREKKNKFGPSCEQVSNFGRLIKGLQKLTGN